MEKKHVHIYSLRQIQIFLSIKLVGTVASQHKTEPDLNKNGFSIANPITVSWFLHSIVL